MSLDPAARASMDNTLLDAWNHNEIGLLRVHGERIYFLSMDQQEKCCPLTHLPLEHAQSEKDRVSVKVALHKKRDLSEEDGSRDGYEPFVIEPPRNGWKDWSFYIEKVGKSKRLTREEEFHIGETMEHHRSKLAGLLFRSDYGIALLVDAFYEPLRKPNGLSRMVDRNEYALDGTELPLQDIVETTLTTLRNHYSLNSVDYTRLQHTHDEERKNLLEAIKSRRERMHALADGLHLRNHVISLLTKQFLDQSDTSLHFDPHAMNSPAQRSALALRDSPEEFEGLVGVIRRHYEAFTTARDSMILANTRLVLSIARKYWGRGLPLMDLVMEGSEALVRSAEYYDHRLGYRFNTYATEAIERALRRTLLVRTNLVRSIPSLEIAAIRLRRERETLFQKYERAPTSEELCEHLGISTTDLRTLEPLSRKPLSLDATQDDQEDGTSLLHYTPANEPRPFDFLMRDELHTLVGSLLNDLPPREATVLKFRRGIGNGKLSVSATSTMLQIQQREIRNVDCKIRMRLGINRSYQIEQEDVYKVWAALSEQQREIAQVRYGLSGREFTLGEIGRLLGLSRERVRQIEVKAMDRLRRRTRKLEDLTS